MFRGYRLASCLLVLFLAFSSACAGPRTGDAGSPSSAPGQNAPIRTFSGGTASATIKVGDETFSFTGGECSPGRTADTLAVNIGEVGGATYFGFGVGKNPGEYDPSYATAARSVKGGGQFAGRYELIIAIKYDGKRYSPVPESAKATITSGLASGEFTGTTEEGAEIAASFKC